MISHLPSLCLALVLCPVGGLKTLVDSPLDKADPQTKALFLSVAESYKALSTYRDNGEFQRSIRLRGIPHVERSPLSFKLSRPNRLVLDAGEVRVIGDSKTWTTVLGPTKRYLVTPAQTKLDPTTIADGPAGAILLGGVGGPPAQLLLKLLCAVDPATALPDRATSLKIAQDLTVEGKTWNVLRVEMGDEPAFRLLIDPKTKLIRRMEFVVDEKSQASKIPKAAGELAELKIWWDSGEIGTGAISDDSFKFQVPAGFVKVKSAEAAAPAKATENELLGKTSPDFTLTMLDGAGRTKKVTRADLEGKVVVLDFWATWCPPCLAELPEIQSLADSYAKAGKTGVVFIAISQDRAPEDGSTVRTLVENLLRTKSLAIDKPPISRVALDPEQETGDVFKVQALPTLVILDTKGLVQAVRVGFNEDIKEALALDIDNLLQGKSLVPADAGKVKK